MSIKHTHKWTQKQLHLQIIIIKHLIYITYPGYID